MWGVSKVKPRQENRPVIPSFVTFLKTVPKGCHSCKNWAGITTTCLSVYFDFFYKKLTSDKALKMSFLQTTFRLTFVSKKESHPKDSSTNRQIRRIPLHSYL